MCRHDVPRDIRKSGVSVCVYVYVYVYAYVQACLWRERESMRGYRCAREIGIYK